MATETKKELTPEELARVRELAERVKKLDDLQKQVDKVIERRKAQLRARREQEKRWLEEDKAAESSRARLQAKLRDAVNARSELLATFVPRELLNASSGANYRYNVAKLEVKRLELDVSKKRKWLERRKLRIGKEMDKATLKREEQALVALESEEAAARERCEAAKRHAEECDAKLQAALDELLKA